MAARRSDCILRTRASRESSLYAELLAATEGGGHGELEESPNAARPRGRVSRVRIITLSRRRRRKQASVIYHRVAR